MQTEHLSQKKEGARPRRALDVRLTHWEFNLQEMGELNILWSRGLDKAPHSAG